MAEEIENSTQILFDSIWGDHEKQVQQVMARAVTHEDVEYVCNHVYPYLQIINTGTAYSEDYSLQFILLPNHWVIYDYGDALSTAVSHFYRKSENEEGGEDGEGGEGGVGTIIKQQFDTIFIMIQEAKTKGWTAIEIIGGTELMKSYAWICAQELGINIEGYTPTADDYRRQKLVHHEREVAKETKKERELNR